METWNCIPLNDGVMVLANAKRTLITFRKKLKVDIAEIMSKLEELGVPLAYADDIEEIYFTYIGSGDCGDFYRGRIRLDCSASSREEFVQTIIHELAHSVNEREFISIRDEVVKERKKYKYFLQATDRRNAKKNTSEYVSVGFELFYCGSKKDKRRLKRHSPKLYKVISQVHKKYRSRETKS